jgi:hypothetical protein
LMNSQLNLDEFLKVLVLGWTSLSAFIPKWLQG